MIKIFSDIRLIILVLIILIGDYAPIAGARQDLLSEKPLLHVAPATIDFNSLEDPEGLAKKIVLKNTGGGVIKWFVMEVEPWLILDRYSGQIGNDPEIIHLMVNPDALSDEQHRTKIIITSTGGTKVINVRVNSLKNNLISPAQELEKIKLQVLTRDVPVGNELLLKAIGIYPDESEKAITADVEWISSDDKKGYFSPGGVFTGKSVGEIKVYAQAGKIKSPVVSINVTALENIALQIENPDINLERIEKNTKKNFPISIRNIGKETLKWEFISTAPWIVSPDDPFTEPMHTKTIHGPVADNHEEGQKTTFQRSDCVKKIISGELAAGTAEEIVVSAYPINLTDGDYEGIIQIKSNGGNKDLHVFMKVISLKSIFISPVCMRIGIGQRRTFRALGIWSDGSRTDISGDSNGQWILSDSSIGSFVGDKPVFVAKRTGQVEIIRTRGDSKSKVAVVDVQDFMVQPVLAVSPREIKLGSVGPGESARGILSLKNMGSQDLIWSIDVPDGWIAMKDRTPSGLATRSPHYVHATVKSLLKENNDELKDKRLTPVTITLSTSNGSFPYRKNIPLGTYREKLRLRSNGGERTVFLSFNITEEASRPCLGIETFGLDFGAVETSKQLMKKIKITNTGKDVLHWKAFLQENRSTVSGIMLKKGTYVSLLNDKVAEEKAYTIPDHLQNSVSLSGNWEVENGYPVSYSDSNRLNYTFSGKGIDLFLVKNVEGGTISTFVDGTFMREIECSSEREERVENLVSDDLKKGNHTLTVVTGEGKVLIEGMRSHGGTVSRGRPGWVRISADSGRTAREVDYVNVMVNSKDLKPGLYRENIIFKSSSGTKVIPISLKVKGYSASELIDIYRYKKKSDCLLTPLIEFESLELAENYQSDGITFRLFRKCTPGTTEYFSWYNKEKGLHFYSYDRNGEGKSLEGYEFEGSIGNIATSRLSKTKELYRWYNSNAGAYFYTTDSKGGGVSGKGYRYDGIAGYVR